MGILGTRSNHRLLVAALLIAAAFATSAIPTSTSYPTGIDGAAVANGCVCHGDGAADPDVTIHIDGVPETWEHGASHEIHVSIESDVVSNQSTRGGLNVAADLGTLAPSDDNTQLMGGEITHTLAGNDHRNWSFVWNAPSGGSGDATLSIRVNAVDGDGTADGDDRWNIATLTIEGPPADTYEMNRLARLPKGREPNLAIPAIIGLAVAAFIIITLPHGGGLAEGTQEGDVEREDDLRPGGSGEEGEWHPEELKECGGCPDCDRKGDGCCDED